MKEQENLSNGGSTLDLEKNEHVLNSDSSDSSSSESESSSDNDNEIEEGEFESNSNSEFTAIQLQSLAMIAFLLRHNLTGLAVNDVLGLIKVICPGSSELGGMRHDELFQVINNVNCKMFNYCSVCHSSFSSNPDIFFL